MTGSIRLADAIKQQAGKLDAAQGRARFGLVASVDPTTATARVLLQPEGVLSGWLPVLSAWIGAGWGMWCPPSPGDQVLVLAQEGDADHGIVVGRAYSAQEVPPPAAVGELCLRHASGSLLRLANSGTVEIVGPVQIQGTVSVQGDVIVAGGVSTTGTIAATGGVTDAHGSLGGLRGHYDSHTHLQSSGGSTSGPTPQD